MEKRKERHGAAIAAAFLAAILIKNVLFDFMIVRGRSMLPAIEPGAVLCVNRLAYGFRLPWSQSWLFRWSLPREGEVVVFRTPGGSMAVKRCGGTSGGAFFARGDNSPESYDSRSYGPVPVENIVGKVVGIR
jgi:signal peptidase I